MSYGSIYGFKTAVAVIVFYFGVKMLVQFEEILLPFIMALLLVSVLEPIKQGTLEVFECSLVLLFQNISVCSCCLRNVRRCGTGRSSKTQDLHELSKRVLLILSICLTICLAARCFWIVAQIIWLSGEAVTEDFDFYKKGVVKRGNQVQEILKRFHLEKTAQFDMEDICNMAIDMLRYVAEILTKQVFYTLTQLCLTVIFVLFLLYSPVQRDFSPVTRNVFESMELYLKLKTLISLVMGITNGLALALIGLELPAAWGLMTFLANFIPNVGGPVMSILPCVIALLDVRKSFYQVSAAFLAQFFLHFNIANFVEPVVFGTTTDIHSVVVLLGLSFFGYIWGFTGMFLSVPLLFAMHAWLDVTVRNPSVTPEAQKDARFLLFMLEGQWLADAEPENGPEEPGDADAPVVDQQPIHYAISGQSDQGGSAELPPVVTIQSDGMALESVPGMVPDTTNCQCGLTPPPISTWGVTRDLHRFFAVRNPDTHEIQMWGLLLRFIVLTFFYMFVFRLAFFQWDLRYLIHPSGETEGSSTSADAADGELPVGALAPLPFNASSWLENATGKIATLAQHSAAHASSGALNVTTA